MQIKCPHCNQEFNMDANLADHIREQVRTQAFNEEIAMRESVIVSQEREKWQSSISELKEKVLRAESEVELAKMRVRLELEEDYRKKLSDLELDKNDLQRELDYYKDLKARLSTKMVGESLEQHCEAEFNKIRMTAFPNSYFSKDNVVSGSGSKGDYIFRDFEDGTEFISIMFEMKTEMDTTSTKKKNEHFFKELDKDRREKGCEYAVLVTLLEKDNEFYNTGIVDVSWQYPKMFVIRPQFFIIIISLLRNAALASLESKKELEKIRDRDVDIKRFEDSFDEFKKTFGYNCDQSDKRLDEAIKDIDKAITNLNNIRASILASKRQMRIASDKLNNVTIEKPQC